MMHLISEAVFSCLNGNFTKLVHVVHPPTPLLLCRHLASCALTELFSSRPALMITDAVDALSPKVDSTSRDIEFLGESPR